MATGPATDPDMKYFIVGDTHDPEDKLELPMYTGFSLRRSERWFSPEDFDYVDGVVVQQLWPYMEEVDEITYRLEFDQIAEGNI